MTKKEILSIAKNQLALDMNCGLEEFVKEENVIVERGQKEGRRIYSNDHCFLKILCFGSKVIISTNSEMKAWCEENLGDIQGAWLFEYPTLRTLDKALDQYGHEIADAHHYYLPNPDEPEVTPITEVKWYEYEEIFQFQGDKRFEQSFAFNESHPDVLAVAAWEDGQIIGMAGASADSQTMWQIGIDVDPAYRGRGIGVNLVTLLKQEILKRGKVPFYGTVESHIVSQNVALKAGFFPAWAELYTRSKQKD